jgi:GNAT superfamily N-acetyltransferase
MDEMISPNIIEQDATLWMATDNLARTPAHAFPDGYGLRWYQPGDEDTWVQLHVATVPEMRITRDVFIKEYGTDARVLAQRLGFLTDLAGHAIGTAAAWIDQEYQGKTCGRVHWVAIVPGYQGRGLSKPLLSAICQRLLHLGQTAAYLVTSTGCVPAINLYRSFGFEPVIRDAADREVWRELAPHLKQR